jgi:hypothetical protein
MFMWNVFSYLVIAFGSLVFPFSVYVVDGVNVKVVLIGPPLDKFCE